MDLRIAYIIGAVVNVALFVVCNRWSYHQGMREGRYVALMDVLDAHNRAVNKISAEESKSEEA